jgi:hypothetical protein
MSGFIYCLDTAQKSLLPEDCPEIRDLLPDMVLRPVTSDATPTGRPGLLVYSHIATLPSPFRKSDLKWFNWGNVRMASGDLIGVSIACIDKTMLEPRHFARDQQTFGMKVELADGHDWMMPTIYSRTGKCLLQPALTLDLDGNLVEVESIHQQSTTERFRELFDVVHGIHTGTIEMETIECVRVLIRGAIDALSMNYHIGPQEAGLLGLLNEVNSLPAASAVVNYDLYVALLGEKKKITETVWYQRAEAIRQEGLVEPSTSGAEA